MPRRRRSPDLILTRDEWTYADAYKAHLAYGDPPPDPAGLDPGRVADIEQKIRAAYYRWRNQLLGPK
jgi:hypothetical protein